MDSPGPPCRVLGWGSHQIWESLLGVTHKQRRRELNNQLCVQWRSTSRHLHGPIQYFKIKQDCPGFLAKKDPSQSQSISRDRKQLIHEHTFQMQTGSSPLLQRLPLLGSQTPACSPTCPAPMARYQTTRGSRMPRSPLKLFKEANPAPAYPASPTLPAETTVKALSPVPPSLCLCLTLTPPHVAPTWHSRSPSPAIWEYHKSFF